MIRYRSQLNPHRVAVGIANIRTRLGGYGIRAVVLLASIFISVAFLPHHAAAAERPLFAGCGHDGQLKFAPREIAFTGCVQGSPQRVAEIGWKGWGSASATGYGRLENLKECGYTGCEGTPVGPVSIILDRPRQCSSGPAFLRVTARSLKSRTVIRQAIFPCPGPAPIA